MAEKITSASNETVKLCVRLRDSTRARRENGLFFLEGARLCADAASSGYEPVFLFYTEQARERYAAYLAQIAPAAGTVCAVSPAVAGKLADTRTPQGVFAVFRIPSEREAGPLEAGAYVALEQVQDPGNLGAICRTAEAIGVRGVLLSGCCDRYNPKAQRAAMGSLLRLKLYDIPDLPACLQACGRAGFKTYASVPDSAACPVTQADFTGPVITVIGNEGSGITPETAAACGCRITIPMGGRAESLNANSAAAILIWEMMRGRAD